jgi:meckelin
LQVLYTIDLSSFWKAWDILLAVSLVWAGLMWLFSMFTYNRRRRSPPVDRDWLGAAVLNAAGAVGKAFFFLSFAVAGYWFVFYKGQDAVFMMIPEDAGLEKWKTVVTVAVITQAAYIAYILYRQTTNDIFFLDWEKPRWSLEGVGDKNPTPVSVWRTLLVANEWNELQTIRLSSLELTLTTLLLLLYGFDLGGLGAFTPNR